MGIVKNYLLLIMKKITEGLEIESKQVIATQFENHSVTGNILDLYNKVLMEGTSITQGYILDIRKANKVLKELKVDLPHFIINTVRLRKYGNELLNPLSKHKYVLTLKDSHVIKPNEIEFKLSKAQFKKYWPLTEGARIHKKRLKMKHQEFTFEINAFLDRFLLMAECEVKTIKDLKNVPLLGMDVTKLKNWSNKALSK